LTAEPTHPPSTPSSKVTSSTAPSPETVKTGLNDSELVVIPEVATAPPTVLVPTKAPAVPPTPSVAPPSLTTHKTGDGVTTVSATAEPPTPDPTPTHTTVEPETDTSSLPTDATVADISKPPGTI
ncbi:hypothetical protein M9458_042367, partial [Cirrhinus mrigala]